MFGHDMNPNSDIYTVAICTGTSTVTEKKRYKDWQKKNIKKEHKKHNWQNSSICNVRVCRFETNFVYDDTAS